MLDYEGLTFQEKENVFKFIESSEMQKSKRPTEIKDASEAFLKGMTNDHKKKQSRSNRLRIFTKKYEN